MTINELRSKILDLSIQILDLLSSYQLSPKPLPKQDPKPSTVQDIEKSGRRIGKTKATSAKGITAIKTFEGFREVPYEDVGGVLTVGYGHTGKKACKRISKEEAEKLLIEDVRDAEACINKFVTASLLQHEFDALVSLIYNIGAGAFKKSTLLKKLNTNAKYDAANEFLRWDIADGKKLTALNKRRRSERRMFLASEYKGYNV